MPAMEDRDEPPGSRSLAVASGSVLLVAVLVGVVVGAYAVHNPNHIQLGAWPPVAELVAAATGSRLAMGFMLSSAAPTGPSSSSATTSGGQAFADPAEPGTRHGRTRQKGSDPVWCTRPTPTTGA
jgi:hypothetical protein